MKTQKAKKLLHEWQYGDSLDSLLLAYRRVFKTDLKKRLDSIDDSIAKNESCNWELNFYGFGKPQDLKIHIKDL